MAGLTDTQRLKFRLLADGARVSVRAQEVLRDLVVGQLTPADYASTSGLIVRLDGEVWVNMPVAEHNPNFVGPSAPYEFDHGDDGFFVHGAGFESRAEFWPPPAYHDTLDPDGRPLNNFVYTHGDRVRLSPTIGCAMVCTFCNVPYDDTYAGVKPVDAMIRACRLAMTDPVQPAHHMLISGGTPGPPHVAQLRDVYERVLRGLAGLPVDIMMVPVDGLFDLPTLVPLGLNQLSINLEIYNEEIAASMMRHKYRQGRSHYLDFISNSAAFLGAGRVRSMLMVGLEPLADTIAGVRAIVSAGGVPVLSPFRPDPATPLAHFPPPTGEQLERAYLEAVDAVADLDGTLGPDCGPCTHNTLTFVQPGSHADRSHGAPNLLRGTE